MIECQNVIKEFGHPTQRVLHGLSFSIADGEFVSISGRSGSGKSTLLYLISTLDAPSSGQVLIDGTDVAMMKTEALHKFRNLHVGFVFQFHYLLPELTTLENILLPARNLGRTQERTPYALKLMEEMGIGAHARKLPGEMSGGEQQRVAIARALIMEPRYVFADEPTGNLDTTNAGIVMSMLKRANSEKKTTLCLVTHDPQFSAMAGRQIHLVDGRIA